MARFLRIIHFGGNQPAAAEFIEGFVTFRLDAEHLGEHIANLERDGHDTIEERQALAKLEKTGK